LAEVEKEDKVEELEATEEINNEVKDELGAEE